MSYRDRIANINRPIRYSDAKWDGAHAYGFGACILPAMEIASEADAEIARLRAEVDALRGLLREILDYSGGANSPLEDEYVVERARAALAKAGG